MKKLSFSIVCILILYTGYAQYSFTAVNSEQVRKDLGPIAADNNGNIILSGTFTTSLTLGDFTLANNNGYDQAFIAKKSPGGGFTWAKMLTPLSIPGSHSYARVQKVRTDVAGNVYITGYFSGKITLDNKMVTSAKSGSSYTMDLFTYKISPGGVALWGNSNGTPNDGCNAGEIATSITTDNAGNVYTTGRKVWKVFKNTTICNAIPGGPSCSNATSKSITCPVVIKYNSAGQKQWEKQYVNNGAVAGTSCWYNHPEGTNIATDGTDIYVNGYFYGTVDFGAGPLSTGSETVSNSFLVKLNAAGTTLWSRSITGNGNNPFSVGDGLFVVGSDIYLSGIGDNISFGACYLPVGGPPAFLAKYSASGSCQWAVKPRGLSYGVVNHPNGNLASLIRKGAATPMLFDIKEFSPLDGSAVDSTCFLVADTATGNITGYPSIAQTPTGFVFSHMVTGTYQFGSLTVTASIPKGAGWPDMMLISYTGTPPPVARRAETLPESSLSQWVLYPNPASSQVTIRSNHQKSLGQISIYDVSGKIIYKRIVGSYQATIELTNFSAGVYYLRSDQWQGAIKFVKQ